MRTWAMIEAKILKLSDRRWGNIEGSKHLEVYIMNKYPENAGNKNVFLLFQNGPLLKNFHWELQEPHTFRSVLGLAESRDMHGTCFQPCVYFIMRLSSIMTHVNLFVSICGSFLSHKICIDKNFLPTWQKIDQKIIIDQKINIYI